MSPAAKEGSILDVPPVGEPLTDRSPGLVASELRRLLASGELDLPLPGAGRTDRRWAGLAAFGRRDLCLARLAEGHTDAVAILAEAGRRPALGCLYGVWASRYQGQGARLEPDGPDRWLLRGTVAFCSGAGHLDRALVVAAHSPGSMSMVEVDLSDRRVVPDPGSWPAIGMDASVSLDVDFRDVPVGPGDLVGPPGFYTERCGFLLGGAGVAAVWLGGAAGTIDSARRSLAGREPDPHRLAVLGDLHWRIAAVDALLARSAAEIDAAPQADHSVLTATCRSAAEDTARRVVDRVPLVTGPSALSRERDLAQRLADLQVYIRQHHGGADLSSLGGRLLAP